jgi:hypothetical protein
MQPRNNIYDQAISIAFRWTPRTIVAGLGGYYSLGIAYEHGIMAFIDRLAIAVLRKNMGYVAIGAFMPTLQWYSAWAVRLTAAIMTGLLYDLTERVAIAAYTTLTLRKRTLKTGTRQAVNPTCLDNQLTN